MKLLDDSLTKIDKFQQKTPILNLVVGVIKRAGEDEAAKHAALITYYGFLSLFPLLMVATTIISLLVQNNHALEIRIMSNISSYFPVIGQQLTQNIKATSGSGLPLVGGLIIAIYGARGGADAFRTTLLDLFKVPKDHQPKFPETIWLSLAMIIIGGLGLYSAAILSTYAGGLGKSIFYKIISGLISFGVMLFTFYFLFSASLDNQKISKKDRLLMSANSSLGIIVIQLIGGYLVSNQLAKMSPLYGSFALVLGLLFWIYLQSLIVMYAIETRIVKMYSLWPRTLTGKVKSEIDLMSENQINKIINGN